MKRAQHTGLAAAPSPPQLKSDSKLWKTIHYDEVCKAFCTPT